MGMNLSKTYKFVWFLFLIVENGRGINTQWSKAFWVSIMEKRE